MLSRKVKTNSGRVYHFLEKGNDIYMLRGLTEYLVVSMTLEIGKPMEVRGRQLDLYTGEPSDEITTIISTPVVEIM